MDKVVYTDEFENWFDSLEEPDQDRVAVSVNLLAQMGVSLPFPHSSAIVDTSCARRWPRQRVVSGTSGRAHAQLGSRVRAIATGEDPGG